MEITNTQLATTAPTSPATVELGTLAASSPKALVAGASEMATELAQVIRSQNLYKNIQGKAHVMVEGWTTLAVMLGVTAREVSTIEENGVYIATVELVRMSDGAVISRASAECGDESPWNKRAKYARRSMAQTRATGKACRLAFSWIMKLAGYEATPAEEMPHESLVSAESGNAPHRQTPSPHDGPRDERGAPTQDLQPKGINPGNAPHAEGESHSPKHPGKKRGAPISEAQHKRLEARINDLCLDRERVKKWALARFPDIEHLTELDNCEYQILDVKLEGFAAQAAREEAEEERAAIQEESANA